MLIGNKRKTTTGDDGKDNTTEENKIRWKEWFKYKNIHHLGKNKEMDVENLKL